MPERRGSFYYIRFGVYVAIFSQEKRKVRDILNGPLDPRDPFHNPANDVETWRNRDTGQINQKVIRGPDKNDHRYYDPRNGRTGQTGPERPGRDR